MEKDIIITVGAYIALNKRKKWRRGRRCTHAIFRKRTQYGAFYISLKVLEILGGKFHDYFRKEFAQILFMVRTDLMVHHHHSRLASLDRATVDELGMLHVAFGGRQISFCRRYALTKQS